MSLIDQEMDEEMYNETSILHKRHLTDAVLRTPLKDVQRPGVLTVNAGSTIQTVVEMMRDRGFGAVLVCDAENKKLLGIFTERDLLLRVAGRGWDFRKHIIDEVMTRNPECLSPRDSLGQALNKMIAQGYRHIPLLNDFGAPYGMVSVRSLLEYLCEHFPEDVMNQPPDSLVSSDRDGG